MVNRVFPTGEFDQPPLDPLAALTLALKRTQSAEEITPAMNMMRGLVRRYAKDVRHRGEVHADAAQKLEAAIIDAQPPVSLDVRSQLIEELMHTFRVWVRGKQG